MLLNQATALQSLFSRLAELGLNAQNGKHLESYLRLALKAQAQCRTTLEALSSIRNPKMVVTRQTNIAGGHQQINNGVVPEQRKTQNVQNQLLGLEHEEQRVDAGAQAAPGRADSSMEAVGAVHRPQDD